MTFETLNIIYDLLLETSEEARRMRKEAYRAFVAWRAENPNLSDNEYPDYRTMEKTKRDAEYYSAALHEFESVKWSGVAGMEV